LNFLKYCIYIFILITIISCSEGKNNSEAKNKSSVTFNNQSFDLSSKEIELYIKLSEAGDPESARKLANYYNMVAIDLKKGFFWNEKAARNGHIIAQFEIGRDYVSGVEQTCKKDLNKAKYWLEKAAKRGDPDAKHYLSLLLSQSEVDALKTMANHGDADAAFKLSEYYYFIEQNKEPVRLYWLKKAAQNGNEKAKKELPFFDR